jgi:membrane protein YdbS with pleckstrin-like domain
VDGVTRLDPRFIPLQREVGWYFSAVVSIALAVGGLILFTPRRWPWVLALWAIGTVAIAWFSHWWAAIEYRYVQYRVDEHGIEIWSGVLWRIVTNVPRSRVQHIDVSQGPIERRHGLSSLVIYTAGTEHSKVALPGLDHQTALGLRDQLLPQQAIDAV